MIGDAESSRRTVFPIIQGQSGDEWSILTTFGRPKRLFDKSSVISNSLIAVLHRVLGVINTEAFGAKRTYLRGTGPRIL